MSKNIVVCCDGTWDGAHGGPASNVLKLFNALDGNLTLGDPGAPEQERRAFEDERVVQVAKYIHGVGDSGNWLDRLLGGAMGMGLLSRVLRGYTYISRQYEAGDRIYLVGFSRGAYTARALAGLISGMGLLDYGSLNLKKGHPEETAYKHAAAAWLAYQEKRSGQNFKHLTWDVVKDFMTDLGQLLPALETHQPKYFPDVKVEAVGVWDTVGSLGIPLLSADHGVRLDALRFADTTLAVNINHAFHAVAADEQRIDFTPTLWDTDPRVVQRFFPGSHGDVGGGYPEGEHSGLSDLALAWMADRLKSVGVRFASDPPLANAGSPLAPLHMAWTASPYDLRPSEPREFPHFTKEGSAIEVDDALKMRVAQMTQSITATEPPVTHQEPYLPMALVRSGHLNVAGVTVKDA
jgi:glutathione S-transferase